MLAPSQQQRLRNLADCSLFQHFYSLSSGLLASAAIEAETRTFTTEVKVGRTDLNSLGLLPASAIARLMEDAVGVLGYVLTAGLLLPVRVEADYLHTAGLGDTLTLRVRLLKHHVHLHLFSVEVTSGSRTLARANVSALEVRRFPDELQQQILRAAEAGVLVYDVLLEFVHLMDVDVYMQARALTHPAAQAERRVSPMAAPPVPTKETP